MPYSIKNDTTQNRDEKCLLMTYDDKSTEEGVSMLLVWKCLLSEWEKKKSVEKLQK